MLIFLNLHVLAQGKYEKDPLGEGFLKMTIEQPVDYEGRVTCTLIRKESDPANKNAVLYIHGFNDYFFQQEMASEFNAHGFRFYALDLRKYGRSFLPEQKFNNVRDLTEYFADIDTALRIIQQEGAGKVLLCGHSTGGLISTLYAGSHANSDLFDAVFLNSPFFDMNMNKVLEKTVLPSVARKGKKKPDKLLSGGLTKWYGWSLHKGQKGEWDYNLAWKPHTPPAVNYGWISAIVTGQKKIDAGIAIDKPMLVMHSDKSVYTRKWTDELFNGDAVLSVRDIASHARKLEGTDIRVQVIPGGMHDLVLSRPAVREKVYKDLFLWTAEKL